jgi:hypothetical protein
MPRYAHRAGGSGETIYTTSPIYQYGVDTGNPPPPMTDKFPADKWTGMLQKPKGERDRYDDSTPPRYSESGANYGGLSAGKTASPNVTAPPGKAAALDRGIPRGIPDQDRFNRGIGWIGTGEGGSAKGGKGVSYKDGEGRTKYRGRSG